MNLDHLEQLTSEANSGVVLKNMKIHMALSPSALGKLNIFLQDEIFWWRKNCEILENFSQNYDSGSVTPLWLVVLLVCLSVGLRQAG